MYSVITGIKEDVNNPGYKHIILKPHPDVGLKYAKASYDSQYGKIMSMWQLEGDSIKIDIEIPHNTTATLYLPGKSDAPLILGSGKYSYQYAYSNE
jgi:alpha-L-rhamnosidase